MPKDEETTISLRLPKELHAKVATAAKKQRHSTNSEIVVAVEKHLEKANAR